LRYTISAALSLFAFWLLLSGFLTPLLLVLGGASALAVTLLARRMELLDDEGHPVRLVPRIPRYWPWLWKEIVKSAWDVSLVIVNPRLPVSPTFVRLKPSQKTTVGLVTYANSITLTPGTLTVDVSPDEVLVHALTREGAEALLDGEMDRRVSDFERPA
jgi:multicomponent Na+:H+ antiporter subunit E